MAELELLRSLPTDLAEPTEEARARAHGRLLRHMRRNRRTRRGRLIVPAVALAGAGAIVALVGVGTHGETAASAAPVLRRVSHVALRQPAPAPLARGRFRYTKSVIAYLVIDGDKNGWVALAPKVREIWIGPTGGRLHETSSGPVFLSTADREHWIAAGRPQVNAPEATETLPPERPLDLPTDPDALYAKLHDQAVGNANGTEAEMLTEVGLARAPSRAVRGRGADSGDRARRAGHRQGRPARHRGRVCGSSRPRAARAGLRPEDVRAPRRGVPRARRQRVRLRGWNADRLRDVRLDRRRGPPRRAAHGGGVGTTRGRWPSAS